MTRHTNIHTRILSVVLSVALICTISQATIYAAETSDVSTGASLIATIHSFDGLEPPFFPVEDSDNTYSLTVKPGTALTDLNLPARLTATVERTATVTHPEVDEEIKDSGAAELVVDTSSPDATAEITEEIVTATETIPVTWDSDPAYDPQAESGSWIFTARLPTEYTLGDGVTPPELYVMIGGAVMLANGVYDIGDAPIDITGTGTYTITGKSTENTILVSAASGDIDITLDNVEIENGIGAPFRIIFGSQANVTITLQGNNLLNSTGSSEAGLQKPEGTGVLGIIGSGSLNAFGVNGAAIGGGYRGSTENIIIAGNAKVTARNNGTGAGIGGGYSGNGTKITIYENAVVNAYGGSGLSNGAGIGGGNLGGEGSDILITGNAIVNASSGNRAAGIGGGFGGEGNNITINGNALVHAVGGTWSSGIGGGNADSDAGGGSGSGNSISGNAVVFAVGGSSGDPVQGMTQTGGILFQGKDGIMMGDVTLIHTVDIPTGHTVTVPLGNTLTNEGVLSVHGILNHGGINGELVNNGTLNMYPAGTTLTVKKNGQTVTQVSYGDTVTLEMVAQASTIKARSASTNMVDFYVQGSNGLEQIGSEIASFSNGVATARLTVSLTGSDWGVDSFLKMMYAEYGGTSPSGIPGSIGMLDSSIFSSIIMNPVYLLVADITAADREYDGTTNVSLHGGVLSGVISGETVNVPTTGIIRDADVGIGKPVTPQILPPQQNYTLITPPGLTVNITPATPVVTFANPQETLSYTGTVAVVTPPDISLVGSEQNQVAVSYTYRSPAEVVYQSGLPTGAGTYLVRAETGAAGNYTAATSTNELELTIELAVPTVTFSSTQEILPYTGAAAIVTAPVVTLLNGEPYSGAVLYSFQPLAGAAYLTGLPTDVGTYQIKARIPADGSYTAADGTNEVRLTITSLLPTLIINSYADTVYTGQALADPTDITSSLPNPIMTYAWYTDSGGAKGDKLPGAPKDAGIYHVEGSIAATHNTSAVTSDAVRFTIGKAATPKAEEGNLTVYNNKALDYAFDLRQLLTPSLQFDEETYEIKTAAANSYYDSPTDSDINDGILVISIKAVDSSVQGVVGTIQVRVKSRNYADMDAILTISAVNQLTPPDTDGSSSSSSSATEGGNATGGNGGGDNGGPDNSEYIFWMGVKDKISAANSGDVVKVNARAYDKIPVSVMHALRKNSGVTLVISWKVGKDITIPAGMAQKPESGRIYYPLSRLAELYKEISFVETPMESDEPSLKTGVSGYIQYPDGEQLPLTAGSIVTIDALEVLPTLPDTSEALSVVPAVITPPDKGFEEDAFAGTPDAKNTVDQNGVLVAEITIILAVLCGGGLWIWNKKKGGL